MTRTCLGTSQTTPKPWRSLTKIHLAVSRYGISVNVEMSGGQVNDVVHADSLIVYSPASDDVIANTGFDSQAL